MTQMHVGLICTLLLVGTMAGMFGCMSATRCHRRFAFALCLALTMLDSALLVVLLFSPPSAFSRPVDGVCASLGSTGPLDIGQAVSCKPSSDFSGFHQGKLGSPTLRAVFCLEKRTALPEELHHGRIEPSAYRRSADERKRVLGGRCPKTHRHTFKRPDMEL